LGRDGLGGGWLATARVSWAERRLAGPITYFFFLFYFSFIK
jgi:hypothetical protein